MRADIAMRRGLQTRVSAICLMLLCFAFGPAAGSANDLDFPSRRELSRATWLAPMSRQWTARGQWASFNGVLPLVRDSRLCEHTLPENLRQHWQEAIAEVCLQSETGCTVSTILATVPDPTDIQL